MATKTDQTTRRIVVEVADDHMQAWIRLVNSDDPEPLTSEEIVGTLEEANILVDEPVLERINLFIALLESGQERPERFLVAQGRPAVEGKGGEFLWHESLKKVEQNWGGDAPINYYVSNSIVTAEKDEPIGTLVPAVAGTDGIDVFGKTLAPRRRPKDVELDAGVRMSEDGKTVLTNVAGKVVYEKGTLSISEVFQVRKDVDFETGNIDSTVDVDIHGTVRDLFIVKSAKTVLIGGTVEAATVEADGDIFVRGGIIPRGKGSVRSGSDIVAKFCDEAALHAKGNVKITKGLLNSHIHCEGKLLAAHGAIIGGQVYAREGIEVAILGSAACVPTELIVGIHPDVIRQVEHLRQSLKPKRQAIERVRQTLQPLMANLERLSAAQKERANELCVQAHAQDAEIAETERRCDEMLAAGRATDIPYVLVSKVIHPAVIIRIGRRQTVFQGPVQGPVKIEKRKMDEATEFVAVNQLNGSVTVLQSARVVEQSSAKTPEPIEQGVDAPDGSRG